MPARTDMPGRIRYASAPADAPGTIVEVLEFVDDLTRPIQLDQPGIALRWNQRVSIRQSRRRTGGRDRRLPYHLAVAVVLRHLVNVLRADDDVIVWQDLAEKAEVH